MADASNSSATPIAPGRCESIARKRSHGTIECDVLVVGFGAAGAPPLSRLHTRAPRSIVTDRFSGGGASAKSGGVVYAGGGTRFQKTAGYNDTPDAMYEYLCKEVGDVVVARDAARLLRSQRRDDRMARGERRRVRFPACRRARRPTRPTATTSTSPATRRLRSTRANYPPAPRGHRVKGAGLSGAMLFRALRQSVNDAGARVMTQSSVRRLVVDSNSGAVLGAELWQFDNNSAAAERHRRLSRWAERTCYRRPAVGLAAQARARGRTRGRSSVAGASARWSCP